MKKFYALPILGALAVSTSLCLSGIAAATDLETSMSNPSNWASQAGDYSNHRYSTLDQITAKNVSTLQVAWTMSTGVLRGHEGSPLVVGNTMYIHTPFPNNVYAINLADQTYKWKYEPKVAPASQGVACCDVVNRGPAFAEGRVFFNTLDASTVAVDAVTGQELWRTQLGDIKRGETVVWSYILYKSRAHRDRVNAKVMKDPRMTSIMNPKALPFDGKRMIFGGFKVLVEG